MEKKLYIGNLAYSVTNEQLKELFAGCGDVTDAQVITDRRTGRSKGFGFVTFADEAGAEKAVNEMNGKDVEGRQLRVSEARPPRER
ncbi:RNA-binding protein [Candidatus Micrarchaeota archaeon]|nr:RNA-binding protein [Candidatus Micrarchaeota archaeon]